jgi:hypothetical protein
MINSVFNLGSDHKLFKDGEQAKGVLTNVDQRKSSTMNVMFDVRGHAKLPDGEQVEFAAEKLNSHKLGWFKVGQVVPVRYDADDHTKVALDTPALEAKHKLDRAQAVEHFAHQTDDAAVARADAKLARGGAPGPEDDWPDDGIN